MDLDWNVTLASHLIMWPNYLQNINNQQEWKL